MPPPTNAWPALSTALGDRPRSINERIGNTKHDADRLLSHIDQHQVKIPKPVVDFTKSVRELMAELLKNPLGEDWRKVMEDLRRDTQQIKQDMTTVKIQTDPQFTRPSETGTRSRTWAQVTATALPPSVSRAMPGASPEAAPMELPKDSEISIKLRDQAIIKRLRGHQPPEIKKQAEQARQRAATTILNIRRLWAKKSYDSSFNTRET